MITLDDFQKLEIKICKVLSCEKVPEADKLLKVIFDIGGEERQVMTGMAEFFPDPSVMVGKFLPVLLNLEPRKFRGYESHGMILAASTEAGPVLISPEKEVPPGSTIK